MTGTTDPQEGRVRAKVERERAGRRAARLRRVVTAGIAVAAVVIVAILGVQIGRKASGGIAWQGSPRQGGNIASLTMPALGGDGTISYDRFRDKPLVINFFASWCPNCVAEMPGFQQVHVQLHDKVNFLGVSNNDPEGASLALVAKTGVTYALGVDAHGTLFNATGSLGMPTTLFIAPGGSVVQSYTGAMTPDQLLQLIERDFGIRA